MPRKSKTRVQLEEELRGGKSEMSAESTQHELQEGICHHEQEQEEEDLQVEEETSQGISLTSVLSEVGNDNFVSDLGPSTAPVNPNPNRKGGKRKKPLMHRKRVAFQKKIDILRSNFNPIPFVPSKKLDFPKFENLFRHLGLWDFAHIEFDTVIRSDLLILLIANYEPGARSSVVSDVRIKVNRADLARALKLPVKKEKLEFRDHQHERLSEESVLILENFMSSWVLLHEDIWMMPDEILSSARNVKEGQLHKVDWAGLIWFMVEKELTGLPESGSCFYASHLQCLIKSQRPDLFVKNPSPGVVVDDDEEINEEKTAEVLIEGEIMENDEKPLTEVTVNNDEAEETIPESTDGTECEERDLVEERAEFGLEQGSTENDNVMEFEERKEEVNIPMEFKEYKEEQALWLLNGKNAGEEHPSLHPRLNDFSEYDSINKENEVEEQEKGEEEEGEEEEEEGGEEEEEHENGVDIDDDEEIEEGEEEERFESMNISSLERLGSEVPAIASTIDPSFNIPISFLHQSSDQMLAAGTNNHACTLQMTDFSVFNNGVVKREADENDHDLPHHHYNKKMRVDESWSSATETVSNYLDEIINYAAKVKMISSEKEQVYANAQMNTQLLTSEIEKRDCIIASLQKCMSEEQNKRSMEIYHLQRELCVMAQLINGYKKALKETRRAFAEYRDRCPQFEESLYKDVPGAGGLVLSVSELEKLQSQREEEERIKYLAIMGNINDFESNWISNFEAHSQKVALLANRFLDLEEQIITLKAKMGKA